ncbi:MAG: DnaJ domain-containing protein [Myxococcota bacterium]|nr:DnaJ domain-containing protein [Myxococcota bacterium]
MIDSTKTSPARDPLPEADPFSSTPLPVLLLDLRARSFDGNLKLYNGRQERAFIFRQGAPVLSESNLASDGLCAHLLKEGLLARESLRPVTERAEQRDISQAAALLELEVVKPVKLFHLLRGQIRRHLFDSMDWRTGRYELIAEEGVQTGFEALAIDLLPTVREALAGHWGIEELLAELSDDLLGFPRPQPHFDASIEKLEMPEPQEQLLRTLSPENRLDRTLGNELTSPDVLATLWVLRETGSLEFADQATEPKTSANGDDEIHFQSEIELVLLDELAPDSAAELDETPILSLDPVPSEAEALRAEIEKMGAALPHSDHYEVIGVCADARNATIKKAYIKAAKRYHPDTLARLGLQDLRDEASRVFSRIADAFETLSNPARRKDYDAEQQGDFSTAQAQSLSQAETAYRKGEILLRMGDFAAALPYLDSAVEIWPNEGAYQSGLGWALYKKTPSDPESARTCLERGIELTPQDAVGHFRLGIVLRALGDANAAQASLERAKQLEPSEAP